VHAAIRGQRVDRVPVALWRHFPGDDQTAASLAAAHVAFQQRYRWDFLKVTPASGFYGDDWGLRAGYRPNREGVRHYTDRPVKKAADWARLRPLDVTAGAYGRELRALALVRRELPEDLILATVFSPLTVARTLCGDQALVRYLRENPDEVMRGLEVITEVMARFAAEAVAAGADGIFFATQCATTDYLTVEEYEEFGRPYDLRVLEAARDADLRMLHLHGSAVMFDLLTDYPAEVIHWHDRRTPPTLTEARRRYSGCLAGGLDQDTLATGSPDAVTVQARDAIAQTRGERFILAAGCVVYVDSPDTNLRAARAAVEAPGLAGEGATGGR
jgi:uroporphyrinogen decarboxylase